MKRNRNRNRGGNGTATSSSGAAPGPTFVQTTGQVSTANNSTGTITFTNAFPSNVTAGNFCAVCLGYYNGLGIATSVTIGGSTATLAASKQDGISDGGYFVLIYYVQSASGGTRDVVVNFPSATATWIVCSAEEWTNMAASALDQVPTGINDQTTNRTITSGATTVARELVYAAMVGEVSGHTLAGPTSGYTQTVSDNVSPTPTLVSGYKTVSATGAQSATFTNDAGDTNMTAMATFKAN